jgi:hypothetical protein
MGGYGDSSVGLYDTFYTLLFAYVVAMYLAGAQLTRGQYVIANVMYLLVMATAVLGVHETWTVFLQWVDSAFASEDTTSWSDFRLVLNTTVSVLLVILSIWFGRKVRHPNPE